jgi:non-specific serine/threonine protein kinase
VERDNLRSALNRAFRSGSAEAGLQLAGALASFWFTRGHLREVQGWLTKALNSTDATQPSTWRLKALAGAAMVAAGRADFDEVRALAAKALTLYDQIRQGPAGISPLTILSSDRWNIALSILQLVVALLFDDDPERARPLAIANVGQFEELGESVASAWARTDLAWVDFVAGDLDRAAHLLEASLSELRQVGGIRATVDTLWSAGLVARLTGDYTRSQPLFEEGLELAVRVGFHVALDSCLEGLGAAALHNGRLKRSALLFAAADALREAMGTPWTVWEAAENKADVARLRTQLGDEAFQAAWAEGRAMTLEQAVAYALESAV